MAIKNCRFANVNIFQQNNYLYNAMIHALVRFGKDVSKPLLESLGAIPVIWTSSSPIFCISRSWSQAKHAFLMTTAYLGLLICDVWGCISSIINRLCHKTIPNNKYIWLSEIQIIRLKKKTQNVHRPHCSPEQHSNITNDFCIDTNF